MNKKPTFLATAVMLFCMVPALAEDHATLGSCLAAIAIAEAHNYEWQETAFTADECAMIGGKAIDGGMAVMANPTQKNFNRMVKDIGIDPHANDLSILSTAPPVDLTPKIKVRGRTGSHRAGGWNSHGSHYYGGANYQDREPDWCCLDAPGYVSRNGFYHHYHLYDR